MTVLTEKKLYGLKGLCVDLSRVENAVCLKSEIHEIHEIHEIQLLSRNPLSN